VADAYVQTRDHYGHALQNFRSSVSYNLWPTKLTAKVHNKTHTIQE